MNSYADFAKLMLQPPTSGDSQCNSQTPAVSGQPSAAAGQPSASAQLLNFSDNEPSAAKVENDFYRSSAQQPVNSTTSSSSSTPAQLQLPTSSTVPASYTQSQSTVSNLPNAYGGLNSSENNQTLRLILERLDSLEKNLSSLQLTVRDIATNQKATKETIVEQYTQLVQQVYQLQNFVQKSGEKLTPSVTTTSSTPSQSLVPNVYGAGPVHPATDAYSQNTSSYSKTQVDADEEYARRLERELNSSAPSSYTPKYNPMPVSSQVSREQLKSDEELAKRLQAELYAEASDMEEQQKKEEESKEPGLWDRLFGGKKETVEAKPKQPQTTNRPVVPISTGVPSSNQTPYYYPAGSPVVYGTPQVAPHPVYGQAPGPVLYTNGQGQYFTAVPQPPRH